MIFAGLCSETVKLLESLIRYDGSDEDARKYFDEHPEEFVRPEPVRVSLIFFDAAEGAKRRKLDQDPEIRASLEKLMIQKLVRTTLEEGGRAASCMAPSASPATHTRRRQALRKL